jgi:hypothetical protein
MWLALVFSGFKWGFAGCLRGPLGLSPTQRRISSRIRARESRASRSKEKNQKKKKIKLKERKEENQLMEHKTKTKNIVFSAGILVLKKKNL